MRASRTLIALASGVPFLLTGAVAFGHVSLLSPPPRLAGDATNDQLKLKPCGQATNKRTDKVTTFTPGQKVDIKIKEFIDHPGYFAVAFDPDGDDSFPFPRADMDKVVAATDDPKAMFPISDTVLGLRTDKEKNCYTEASSHECTIPITIPNMTCQNCTLQVTQFMYDKLGDKMDNEVYYQCADIKIEGTPAGGSGSGGTGGSGTGGAATSGGSGGAAGASAGASTGTGGVSVGGTGPTTAGMPATAGTTTSTPTAGSTASTAGASSTGGTPAVTNPSAAATDNGDGGCSVAKRTQGGASALVALGLLFALGRRRRAR